MLHHLRSFLFLLVLFSALSVAAWCQEFVQVKSVTLPELVWNTNTARIALRNTAAQPRTVIINVQARSHHGSGWETEHSLAASESITIDREFTMPPFPGKATVVISIREKGGAEIYKRKFDTEFGLENKRIGKLHPPQWFIEWNPYKQSPLAAEYPPLDMARRGHFVFYYPDNFAYVQTHLTELAEARDRAYNYVRKSVNPSFNDDVAVYLFPDLSTKFAYTGHQGQGWAFDNVLVEVFDPLHPNDPERTDPNHELVHIMTGPLGNPPAMFNEGLAAYLQVDHKWQNHPMDDWARSFDAAGMLMPINRLFALEEIGPKGTRGWVTYPESASMIQYLTNHFGFDKVMDAFRELKSGAPEQQNAAIFERVFGVSLNTFEKDWRTRLNEGNSHVPQNLVEGIQKEIAEDEK
jgi:hypothetical protein